MKIINSSWTIIIAFVSVSVPLVFFFLFHFYIPTNKQAEALSNLADQQEAEANKLGQAKKNVDKAISMVNERTAVWNAYVATHTPPTSVAAGGIDLSVSPLQLVTDTYKYRDSIQKAVNTQVKVGGVTVLDSGPYVPATIDPNYTGDLLANFYHFGAGGYPFPVVIFDFGTIRVRGTYDQIMKNVRSYKTMPHYLAVTDGLRIDGTSPNLVGTYQLSIVGFIRAKTIHSAIPEAAATGSTGSTNPFAGGGFPGGLPGGVPGKGRGAGFQAGPGRPGG